MTDSLARTLDTLEAVLTTGTARGVRWAEEEKRRARNAAVENSPLFRKACELAGVPVTRRQASKWNRHTGAAWAKRRDAVAAMKVAEVAP